MSGATIAIVGGGLAGLVAAHALSAEHEVTVFESSDTFGGKLRSATLLDHPIDLGPDAFITRNPAAVRLCNDLGLGEELLAPNSNSVAIYARGALRRLPRGIVLGVPTDLRSLWRSRVVARSDVVRAATDLLRRRPVLESEALEKARRGEQDPTVEQVFAPRLSEQVVATLIDPLLGGINASDVGSLSLAACAPQLVSRLAGQRSVVRALRTEQATFTPVRDRPPFLGLSSGIDALPRALVTACRANGVELRTGAPVERLAIGPSGRWQVSVADREHDFDAVVLAAPAFVAAGLLGALDEQLAFELGAIPYSGLVSTHFAWPEDAVPARTTAQLASLVESANGGVALPGSGALAVRDGRRLLTALAFTSSKWPRSSSPGTVVVRAFAGRHRDERAVALSDGELRDGLLRDIGEVLGITAPPAATLITRWERALPQYVTGHLARVARIEELMHRHPTLALTGAAFHGIGIPACVEDAEAAAGRLQQALAAEQLS